MRNCGTRELGKAPQFNGWIVVANLRLPQSGSGDEKASFLLLSFLGAENPGR